MRPAEQVLTCTLTNNGQARKFSSGCPECFFCNHSICSCCLYLWNIFCAPWEQPGCHCSHELEQHFSNFFEPQHSLAAHKVNILGGKQADIHCKASSRHKRMNQFWVKRWKAKNKRYQELELVDGALWSQADSISSTEQYQAIKTSLFYRQKHD